MNHSLSAGAILLLLVALSNATTSPYCAISGSHSLCDAMCPAGKITAAPSTADQQKILNWHNQIRSTAALGEESRSEGDENLPASSRMMKLRWDPELAKIAQGFVDNCLFAHDCNECRSPLNKRFDVGQNIASASYKGGINDKIKYDSIMNSWYDEEVGKANEALIKSVDSSKGAGHYTQIIWGKTRSIGCGASIYDADGGWTKHLIVCNYGRAANLKGAEVYPSGIKCSRCPSDTACDSTFDGLCDFTDPTFDIKTRTFIDMLS